MADIKEFCRGYIGFACVNGSCPKANLGEYAERYMDCKNCFYYRGCEDCAFLGMEYCEKNDKKRG